MRRSTINKRFWKNGLSEIVSFLILAPFIVLLICAVLSTYWIGTTNQQLLYTAYSVGRSAVVCETADLAENRAEAIMSELYEGNFLGGEFITDGSSPTLQASHTGEAVYSIEVLGGDEWAKGSLIKCTVKQYITPAMPFTAREYSQSIVMMVENGEGSISTGTTGGSG